LRETFPTLPIFTFDNGKLMRIALPDAARKHPVNSGREFKRQPFEFTVKDAVTWPQNAASFAKIAVFFPASRESAR